MVQKALLCSVSDYFVKALDGPFQESSQSTLRLPGCDADTFRLFLYWLCHRRFPEYRALEERSDAYILQVQELLVRLWCFAEALLLPNLQNETMRYLLKVLDSSRVRVQAIRLMTELAAEDSVLHSTVMREVACDYKQDTYTIEEANELGALPGVMYELTTRLLKRDEYKNEPLSYRAADDDQGRYMVPEKKP